MEDVIDCYAHDVKEQLEIDLFDLFKDENEKDEIIERLHRYSHILLYYNGNRVVINMDQVMFINNKSDYVEFVFNNLARIIIFKDKIDFRDPDYGAPYETLVEMKTEEQSQSSGQIKGIDRREL